MTTGLVLGIGIAIGVLLLALNVREILYLRAKQRELEHPSWLIGALIGSNATTTAVSAVFLALFLVRFILGQQQPWAVWLSVGLILLLLLIPVMRGYEIRRHEP